jgi:hypothetical protein
MMLRSLTLALLASMVMAETVPVGVPTPIENEGAERTEEDWEEDEDDSNIVECTLILLLDDKPSETAWEVRGPLPGVSIAGSAAYDFYEGMERKQMEDTLLLHMGQTYYFLLSDFGQDGIEDGYLKISTDFGSGDITLVEDSTDFGAAKVYMFTVPVPPLASHGDEGEDEPPMDATTV